MTITIMKQIRFCAGHRLLNHGGKCENLHGHNYLAQIFVSGRETDTVGRLVDFSLIKGLFKSWIDDHWDHSMILWERDEQAVAAVQMVQPHRLHLLPYNPTAENMARYLIETVAPRLISQIPEYAISVSKVKIWETETSCAEVTVDSISDNGHVAANQWHQSVSGPG